MKLRLTQIAKLRIVALLGLLACIGGLVWAVRSGDAAAGGLGGAVAVALAFLVLFTSTPSVAAQIEAPYGEGRARFNDLPVEERTLRLRTALAILVDGQRTESRYLAFVSVLGTLVWGFGETLARWLGAT